MVIRRKAVIRILVCLVAVVVTVVVTVPISRPERREARPACRSVHPRTDGISRVTPSLPPIGADPAGTSELPQNATPSGVRERGERSIESGRHILNHMAQYFKTGIRGDIACIHLPLCTIVHTLL